MKKFRCMHTISTNRGKASTLHIKYHGVTISDKNQERRDVIE